MTMRNAGREERHEPPPTFRAFIQKYPELGEAHQNIGHIVAGLGPLDARTRELIKIGISLGAGLSTATRSHVRRALEEGASIAEVEQAILLAMNTCGLPRTVAAWRWAHDQIAQDRGVL